MAIRTKCPSCKHLHTLADSLLGKRIRCQACEDPFEVTPLVPKADPAAPSPRNAVASGAPPRKPQVDQVEEIDDDEDDDRRRPARKPVRRQEVDEDDGDDDEDRPRRSKKRRREASKSSPAVWIVSGVVGVVAFVGALLLVYFLMRAPQAAVVVQGPPPGGQIVPGGNLPGGNPPIANPPIANPPANVPQNPPGGNNAAPPNLYGDQGGDEVLPADATKPNTILRARADDTFYKLSNPRLGQGTNKFRPGQALMVDYEVVRRGKLDGGALVIHDGNRREPVSLSGFGQQDRGTIEVSTFGPFGGFPKNAELYLTRRDGRYGSKSPSFKVSNSVSLGAGVAATTKARNWTAEEIDRYTKDPPNFANANAHPGVGNDTAWAGASTGGLSQRYVEPKGHLLGVDYLINDWEKEKCFWRLGPVFSHDQEKVHSNRLVAKPGYAVANAEVHTGKFIIGLKLTFQKIKADGTLDAADSYASELIGAAAEAGPKKLGGEGRPMIGLHIRHGAVIDGVSFVVR